jgi:hypothetical protein
MKFFGARTSAVLGMAGLIVIGASAPLVSQQPENESENRRAASGPATSPDLGAPVFDADGQLELPDDYREWIFVGSSLGLRYKDDGPAVAERMTFNHVYINRLGYNQFRANGTFPEGTMLMLEVASRAEKDTPAVQGSYAAETIGVEAAVKTSRFGDPWSYFSFDGSDGKVLKKGRRFEDASCIACHRDKADTDHVFTQFYPVLRSLKPSK